MKETIAFILLLLLALDFRDESPKASNQDLGCFLFAHLSFWGSRAVDNSQRVSSRAPIFFAEAKGVAGLGKAGGDNQGGSDKGGQQVPPEVYIALTYAGSAFLLTLSVPLILYGLNKLLNKVEDCFGCGPKSRLARESRRKLEPKTNVASNLKSATEKGAVFVIGDQQRSKNNNFQLDQQLHQHHMQQQYSKYHQLPAFSSLVGNGGCNGDPILGNTKHSPSPANSYTIDFPCDPDMSCKPTQMAMPANATSKKHQQDFHIYHPERSDQNVT